MDIFVELLEALTIFCFGVSWPISIMKSYKSRTTKGKSLLFEVFIIVGYAFGIVRKTLQVAVLNLPNTTEFLHIAVFYLGFFFYVFNFVAIAIDIALYFRNRKLDMQREKESLEKANQNREKNY